MVCIWYCTHFRNLLLHRQIQFFTRPCQSKAWRWSIIPTARPCLLQMACGMISPKTTMPMVAPMTATMPPPPVSVSAQRVQSNSVKDTELEFPSRLRKGKFKYPAAERISTAEYAVVTRCLDLNRRAHIQKCYNWYDWIDNIACLNVL